MNSSDTTIMLSSKECLFRSFEKKSWKWFRESLKIKESTTALMKKAFGLTFSHAWCLNLWKNCRYLKTWIFAGILKDLWGKKPLESFTSVLWISCLVRTSLKFQLCWIFSVALAEVILTFAGRNGKNFSASLKRGCWK